MSTEQKPDINARLEKILADVSDAIDDAITGALDAPDPIAKTQILGEGYAKILRLMLPNETVDGLHLPNPGEVPAHVEHLAPQGAAETETRPGSSRSIKDATAVFKVKGAARVVHTNYLGVDQFLVVTPRGGVNEIVIADDKRVIFEGVSYVGMVKTWGMGNAAFRSYQLARFHNIRHRRKRSASFAPRGAAETDAAAETLARPINPEDDE